MEKDKQEKTIYLANQIGSEGDHNSREFARGILELFDYNISPMDAVKIFKLLKPFWEKYLDSVYLPWLKAVPKLQRRINK